MPTRVLLLRALVLARSRWLLALTHGTEETSGSSEASGMDGAVCYTLSDTMLRCCSLLSGEAVGVWRDSVTSAKQWGAFCRARARWL